MIQERAALLPRGQVLRALPGLYAHLRNTPMRMVTAFRRHPRRSAAKQDNSYTAARAGRTQAARIAV
jgi:hypothetical protein